MQLPRFTPFDDRTLGRFRFQSLVIGVIWSILAGVRIANPDGDPVGNTVTAVIVVIALGFLVTSLLTFVEFRRRSAQG